MDEFVNGRTCIGGSNEDAGLGECSAPGMVGLNTSGADTGHLMDALILAGLHVLSPVIGDSHGPIPGVHGY